MKRTLQHTFASLGLILGLGLPLAVAQNLIVVEENFAGGLGRFDGSSNMPGGGNDLAWAAFDMAGGQSGELAGTLARNTTANASYIGDVTLNGLVSLGESLVLRGKFLVSNFNFDGYFLIGYVNTADLSQFLGVRVSEPGGAFAPSFRGEAVAAGGTAPIFGIPQDTSVAFDLTWDPVAGRLTGQIGEQAIDLLRGPATTKFDAFVVGTWGVGSSNPDQQLQIYLDDLAYSMWDAPPPVSVKITTPVSGRTVASGSSLAIAAEASAGIGAVAKVEFFARETATGTESSLGVDTSAPYQVTWVSVPVGSYELRAVATGSLGQTATSDTVLVTAVVVLPTVTVTETFTDGLAWWPLQVNNGQNGSSLAPADTTEAGGTAPELAGTIARSSDADPFYVGERVQGAVLYPGAQDLALKGRFLLHDLGFDGRWFIGYVNTSNLGSRLGIEFTEPGGGLAGFRANVVAPNGGSPIVECLPETPIEFDLQWSAATGTLTGKLAGQDVQFQAAVGGAGLDAFVVGAWGVGSSNPAQQVELHLDDVSYTFPARPAIGIWMAAPASGTRLFEGEDVTLTASAAAQSGAIQKVAFYARNLATGVDTKIDEVTSAPYTMVWTKPPGGTYDLTAQALTDTGASATSPAVLLTVIRPGEPVTVTENFDAEAGRFDLALNNRASGNDFGHVTSNQAGGNSGEIGGVFARTGIGQPAYVGDGILGGAIYPAHHNLVLKGQLRLRDINFNGSLFIGYVNTQNLGQRFGIAIEEPGGGIEPAFRGWVQGPGVTTPMLVLPDDTVLMFDFEWNATAKLMTGLVAEQPVEFTAEPGLVGYDALIVGTFSSDGTPTIQAELFVDNLTYTVLKVTQPPTLQIGIAGNRVVLGWTGAGFKLEERAGFGPGTAWSSSNAEVIQAGDRFSASIAPVSQAAFYRLTE
ncbi:MAG TPA: Ig-like domain-containing protein [Verrucomicrobiota bacterium]|nr:Ig-like domain-containing protein [Verrucomicrobiota bacterium]